jgi:hypothetical protein
MSTPLGQVLTLGNETLMDGASQKGDEIMTNPMENVAKALMVLHVRIQSTKLIQDAPTGIATLALDHQKGRPSLPEVKEVIELRKNLARINANHPHTRWHVITISRLLPNWTDAFHIQRHFALNNACNTSIIVHVDGSASAWFSMRKENKRHATILFHMVNLSDRGRFLGNRRKSAALDKVLQISCNSGERQDRRQKHRNK